MSDTENESAEPSFEEQVAQAKGEMEAAGRAFMGALATYLDAAKRHYGFIRWGEGYDHGWNCAQEYFAKIQKRLEQELKQKTLAGGIGAMGFLGIAPMPSLIGSGTILPNSPPPTMPTANELVHQFIAENPGKRGVEIAEDFTKTVFKLPERTVRTALHRLKKSTKIKNVDGRWYLTDAAPTEPQFALKE